MKGTTGKRLASVATTLTFDKFWQWLGGHANCIVRAGTPEVVLIDHDDFHWTLMTEDDHTRVVRLARAKDLVPSEALPPHLGNSLEGERWSDSPYAHRKAALLRSRRALPGQR